MAGYGAIGGIDYNDPYLQAALASYNPNFKSSSYVAQNDATQVSNPYAAYAAAAASSGVPQLSTTPQAVAEESGIDTGMIVGGALTLLTAGAALVAGHKAGKGKGVVQGWKNIIKGFGGASKTTAEASQLKVIMTKNGPKYLVPGKRTAVAKTSADIQRLITENNLNVTAERLGLNTESILNGFNFKGNTVTIKDGVITDIRSQKGSILKALENAKEGTADSKLYNDILKTQSELVKGAEADKDFLKGIIDIRYTNKTGDEIYEMLLKRYGLTPAQADIKGLSTLKRFDINAPEVQSLVCSEAEKTLIMPEFVKNKKLTDGMTLGEYSLKINGKKCFFNGKELVAIEGATDELKAGSVGYDNWLNEVAKSRFFGAKTTNQDLVNKEIEKIFEKCEYIPLGAVVKAA